MEESMKALKIIAFVTAGILILFGVLFILGAGADAGGGWGWVLTGIVLVVIAFVLILFAARRSPKETSSDTNVTLQIDLPGEVNMNSIKCNSCGGVLHSKDITLVAGAPVVNCPYCGTTYQITEEPKW
jgi:Na+/melibiose symporter-like transporter